MQNGTLRPFPKKLTFTWCMHAPIPDYDIERFNVLSFLWFCVHAVIPPLTHIGLPNRKSTAPEQKYILQNSGESSNDS